MLISTTALVTDDVFAGKESTTNKQRPKQPIAVMVNYHSMPVVKIHIDRCKAMRTHALLSSAQGYNLLLKPAFIG